VSSPSLRDAKLVELYENAPGAIAFVDESYWTRPLPGQRAFYSMSAVTFTKDQLDHVREVLTDIAGGLYWHTTDAHEAGHTAEIGRMARFLARETQWNVLTVDIPLTENDDAVDRARATCLAAITREVTRGTGPGAVRLIVADRNRDEALNRADRGVVDQLRACGDISRHVGLYHGRMGREPVLWAADLASWSAYRNLSVDDGRWIEPLRDVLTVLDARTGKAVDMKQPQAAVAPGAVAPSPGAQQPVPATSQSRRRQEVTVASRISVPAHTDTRPDFRRGTRVLDDLAAQITRVRREVGARGVVEGNTPEALAARVARRRRAPDPPQTGDLPTIRRPEHAAEQRLRAAQRTMPGTAGPSSPGVSR
jgi:hypothetical protein